MTHACWHVLYRSYVYDDPAYGAARPPNMMAHTKAKPTWYHRSDRSSV